MDLPLGSLGSRWRADDGQWLTRLHFVGLDGNQSDIKLMPEVLWLPYVKALYVKALGNMERP
jgi:hypothetical protein